MLIMLLLLWSLFNLSLVTYGLSQLRGQLNIVFSARPMKEMLADATVPDSVKQKILFIDSVRRYAIDTLGLKDTKNYTTYFEQNNKPLLWVITACEEFSLKPYQWNFPLLGNVSYKGFFNYEKGLKEANEIRGRGYDIEYDDVAAWSTLGWFKDPVLSNMLRRGKGRIAELIIHEMTHATLYVKSNVDFNENLASVCGEEGALQFLRSTYGENSNELNEYVFSKEDYDRFSSHMLRGTQKLKTIYSTYADSVNLIRKKIKEETIREIVQTLDTVNFHSAHKFKNLFQNELPNNAYFLNFIRYDSQKDQMKRELDESFGGNIKLYLDELGRRY